ncbi:MAG: hypothetical protein GC157_09745 [Frankiales bacterium]|nr:hypothetical protein [Frankiales bacterium]
MTGRTDPTLDVAARALAVVLDLQADDLRADSPLDDLGADSIARVLWADAVEDQTAAAGSPLVVDDDAALATATTLGDLAARLAPAGGR